MFTNQENLFLETIKKMLNTGDKKAEQDIKLWAKESYQQILESCNKFISLEQLDPNIRRYSCFLMGFLFTEENYEQWLKIEDKLKNQVQFNSLSLLGNKLKGIRNSASVLVATIEKICIKNREWPNLITTLCNACDSNEIEFKITSIKTLGLIWESIPKENFSEEDLISMENTIIKMLMSSSNSFDLSLECLNAYQYFIKYISERFKDEQYLQSTLKILTTFCNVQNYNEQITTMAIHRISDVVLTAYDYMGSQINNIIEFFGVICNGENDNLAIQGYIFLTELAEAEYYKMIKNITCHKYIDSSWSTLWQIIQNTLNNINNPAYNTDYNSYRALSSLFYYISKICGEKMIDDIFNYMKDKINDQNPLMINSAIYAFASILDTIHYLKIKKVIYSSIQPLFNFLNLKCEKLNKTVAWCFEQICEYHGDVIIKSSDVFQLILNMISNNLKNKDLHLKIKIYSCTTLFSLTQYVKESEVQKLGIFSQYLLDFLKILDYLAFAPSSYNPDYNLSSYCFTAISGLIKCSSESDEAILSLFLEKVLERFDEANDIKNFENNKANQYQAQSFLCMILESFCTIGNKGKLTYPKIELFFNKIELFFQNRGVFEEGLLALSRLSLLLSNKEFSNFMRIIMEHLFNCLKDYQDFSNCKISLLCLIDLIRTSKEDFAPYIQRLIQLFQDIIKKPDANKELLSYFLIIYSDLIEYMGESIWEYVQIPLEYMDYVLKFCVNNCDKYLSIYVEKEDYEYYISLNNNVMDLISNVLKRILNETNERKQAFYQYVSTIMGYLNFMLQKLNFIPDNDYILSCIGTLFDLIEIYKDSILKLINDDTSRRLTQLANSSRDGEIINLNEALQNYISTSQYSLQLNEDDIF